MDMGSWREIADGDVRAKLTGTFDASTKTWRLRTKRIQVSVRQLEKRFGVKIEPTERASRAYWRRFLQEMAEASEEARKAACGVPERIKSIDAMIARFRSENAPQSDLDALQQQLREAINIPPHLVGVDFEDVPVFHPEIAKLASLAGLDGSELQVKLLNKLIPASSTTPKVTKIRSEVDAFVARHKAKGHKGWYSIRSALDLLLQATGDIAITAIDVVHWREFFRLTTTFPSWSKRSQANCINFARTFLKRMEADHNKHFSFLTNPDYRIATPEGQRVQYTIEQVKAALHHATGDARLALLLGLNCGMVKGDIAKLTPAMLHDNHLSFVRAKLLHKTNPVAGSWLLWHETQQLLDMNNINVRRIMDAFDAFRKQHHLPEHKALRKTTAQQLQDHIGEDAARLFRGEKVSGNHGKSYINSFSTMQVKRLDAALLKIAELYGVK